MDTVAILTISLQIAAALGVIFMGLREFRKIQSQTIRDYAESRQADASAIATYASVVIQLEERVASIESGKQKLIEELEITRDHLAETTRQLLDAQNIIRELREENRELIRRIRIFEERLKKAEDEIDSGIHRRG